MGLGLVLTLVLVIYFYRQAQEETQPDLMQDLGLTVSVEDIELVHGAEGQKSWVLTSPKSRYDREKSMIYLDRPRLEFYLDQGQEVMQVQADQGRFDQKEQVASFSAGVKAYYAEMELEASAMQYVEKNGQIFFQGPVLIRHPRMQVRGRQAFFDIELQQVFVQEQVQVELF